MDDGICLRYGSSHPRSSAPPLPTPSGPCFARSDHADCRPSYIETSDRGPTGILKSPNPLGPSRAPRLRLRPYARERTMLGDLAELIRSTAACAVAHASRSSIFAQGSVPRHLAIKCRHAGPLAVSQCIVKYARTRMCAGNFVFCPQTIMLPKVARSPEKGF